MNIFLVRHGKYTPAHIDATEGLSEEGKREVLNLRQQLDKEGIRFDQVLTSPKKRAKETAELLRGTAPLLEIATLKPNTMPEEAYHAIPQTGNVLVVSHLPLLQSLAEKYGASISFEPATLACFTKDGLKKVIIPSS